LGCACERRSFRAAVGGGVLSASVDADDHNNYAPNTLAGYNVNSIVLEVPISLLTVDGHMHAARDKNAVIGTYGATSRQKVMVLRDNANARNAGPWAQVQREGNPLINELIIGT